MKLWRSANGIVHIESPDGVYYCGFPVHPKHAEITSAMPHEYCRNCVRLKRVRDATDADTTSLR